MSENDHKQVYVEEMATIAHGAGLTFFGKVIGAVVQYGYIVFLAKFIGSAAFGLFVLATTLIECASIVGRLGLESAAVKYVSLYSGRGDKERLKGTILSCLRYAFLGNLVISAGILCIDPSYIESLFGKPGLSKMLNILAMALPFSALLIVSLSATQGRSIMKYTVYTQNIIMPVLNLAFAIIVVGFGLGIFELAYSSVFASILGTAIALRYLQVCFRDLYGIRPISENKMMLNFSSSMLIIYLMMYFITWTDTLALGYFRTSSEVGVYNVSVKTAFCIKFIIVSFLPIFSPIISDLYGRNDMRKLEAIFKTVTKWTYATALPLSCLCILLSGHIMALFGKEYISGTMALSILAMAQLCDAVTGAIGLILIMAEKHKAMMYCCLAMFIGNLCANLLLVPSYGLIGAASATLLTMVLFNLMQAVLTFHYFKIHPFKLDFLKITGIGCASYVAAFVAGMLIPEFSELHRILLLVIGFLSFYLTLLITFGLNEVDMSVWNTTRSTIAKKLCLSSR